MKRALIVSVICLAVAALAFSALRLSSARGERQLPDGSKLRLTGLKAEATNRFIHGRFADKLVGCILPESLAHRIAPRNKLRVGQFSFSLGPKVLEFGSPRTRSLTAQFRFQPARGQSMPLGHSDLAVGQSDTDLNHRWIIQGDDEMRYLHWFGLQRHPDGLFSYVSLGIFPRNARYLTFRLEERDPFGEAWTQLAAFRAKNPAVGTFHPWRAAVGPHRAQVGRLEVTLGETLYRADPSHPNDLWRYQAELLFQVKRDGTTETNWNADHFLFEDASGNAGELMGARKTALDKWLVYRLCPGLNPGLAWRISADFGRDSAWPASDQCTLQIPVPFRSPLTTNCHGMGLQISMSGDLIFAELLTNRTDLRLAFVSAKDRTGTSVAQPTATWTAHRFPRGLQLPASGGSIEVTMAIDRIYRMEFYTKPVKTRSEPLEMDTDERVPLGW